MVARLLVNVVGMASAAVGLEPRGSVRIDVAFAVQCTAITRIGQAPTVSSSGKALNASREGMLLALDTAFEPFGLVALQISLKHTLQPMHLVGEVRWMKEHPDGQGYLVGISFVAIATRERERLAEEIYTSRPTMP